MNEPNPKSICDLCAMGIHKSGACYVGGIDKCFINGRYTKFNLEQEREKGCASCNGGFGDNTIEFHKSGYHNCPYCGRKLDELKPKEDKKQ